MLYVSSVSADCRGKGEYYRLGTDSSTLVKEPQQIETLTKKVVQVSVGSLHCLALTDNGEVRHTYSGMSIYRLTAFSNN